MPEDDLRLGWTFVDVEGRCWKAVSSRVVGHAYPWWARLTRGWVWHRRYSLAIEFAQRPTMSFDAVRSRLLAVVKANPKFYGADRRDYVQQLRSAVSLRDIIKTAEELASAREARAIENLRPETFWWQWLFGEGRCSRLAFMIALVLVPTVIGFETAWRIPMPIFLVLLLPCMILWTSAIVRRLHDLRRTGWWLAAWLLFGLVCALAHEQISNSIVRAMAENIWLAGTMAVLGFLAFAPGTRGPNRYGFAPGPAYLRRAAEHLRR